MEDNDVHYREDSQLASSEGEGEDIIENMEEYLHLIITIFFIGTTKQDLN